MNSVNLSTALLAASGGDTVKLFDVSEKLGDPCILSYTPSPASLVNSVKWNHTNLVVASAGDDKRISLWRKNGQSMGTIPVGGADRGDNIDESILAISFSNKVSRYICTGGTGQVVRIWDLQRKRCIKWLKGHTNTITGAMYNCKDEHLASISLSGDLILHNLTSGARTAELKDPNEQVLRVLDYSRISRHLLVTAGDDGTVHLWDTTGRSPKASWLKQHSAPTAGISFSPLSDKIIASIGLDKKLYTFDSGSRRPSSCTPYEVPFSSLAFRDDGLVLAAGTSTGQVVFYDVRGKPKPFTVLRAYSSSEAVSSLCWQRAKPVIVNESSCSSETALLGDAVEDSILMPDPLPSLTSSNLSLSAALAGSRSSLGASTSSGFTSSTAQVEETPLRAQLRPGGAPLSKLHPSRPNYNFKDEMEVFSPLVDVQPITPGLDRIWDEHDRAKKEHLLVDKKPGFLFPSSTRRYPVAKDGATDHPVYDWKSNSTPQQDDGKSLYGFSGSSPSPSSKSEDSSITPPEAWGGEKLSDKYSHIQTLPSRMGLFASSSQTSGSGLAGLPDFSVTSQTTSLGSSTTSNFSYANLRTKEVSSTQESLNPDPLASLTRRFSTYAERISTTSAFGDGTSPSSASPKIKKTGAETREFFGSSLPKPDSSTTMEVPLVNGGISQPHKVSQLDAPQGSSFTLQLFQRTLEETRDSIQKSVHEDIRNLHIEILRQFHMQEMEMSSVLSLILENQAALMEEVKSLKKENQQLRQLL